MIFMLAALGAPVTDAQGNSACRISGSSASVVALTDEVICHTVRYFSTSYNESTCTDPGTAMRPMSFRSMSVIMTFSARSLGERRSDIAAALSSDVVMPRREVPFIGRHSSRVPESEKNNSGEADTMAKSSKSRNAAYGASAATAAKSVHASSAICACCRIV